MGARDFSDTTPPHPHDGLPTGAELSGPLQLRGNCYACTSSDGRLRENLHRGKAKRITEQERKLLKRRQAIEPIIGHLKSEHRVGRYHLKGEQGDRLHAVLCAAGYNIRWLLRMIVRKGVPFLWRLFLHLLAIALARQHDIRPNSSAALQRRQIASTAAPWAALAGF
jgi:hypothetical protein